jgi:hypothetical protein
MDNRQKAVWADDGKPARKVGTWPFSFTIDGWEPMVWVGYDEDSGRELHKIVQGSVGYNVHKVRGRSVDVNFMTLEQAQKYCETY